MQLSTFFAVVNEYWHICLKKLLLERIEVMGKSKVNGQLIARTITVF